MILPRTWRLPGSSAPLSFPGVGLMAARAEGSHVVQQVAPRALLIPIVRPWSAPGRFAPRPHLLAEWANGSSMGCLSHG